MLRTMYKLPAEVIYEGITWPGNVTRPHIIEKVKDFKTRKGDVIVAAHPRSGNNWMQYASYLIQDSRYSDGSEVPHIKKRFMLEFSVNGEFAKSDMKRAMTSKLDERILMTHLYCDRLQSQIVDQGCKTIVIVRNPKDVIKSVFHFYQNGKAVTGKYTGTWDEFFEMYKAKKLFYGDWLDSVTSALKYRRHPNVLFVKYEDAKTNLRAVLLQIAALLEKDISEKRLNELEQLLQLKVMKEQPMVRGDHLARQDIFEPGALLQTGNVGDWRQVFSKKQSDYLDNQCCQIMKHFNYELHSAL